jgi:hypothetical protein
MKYLSLYLLSLFMISQCIAGPTETGYFKCDSIRKTDLILEAKTFKKRMDLKEKFTESESIKLVKISNTLYLAGLNKDKKYNSFISDFLDLFNKKYLEQVLNTLTYTFGKGMTLYSAKHDLYIGPHMTYRCQDQYSLLTN